MNAILEVTDVDQSFRSGFWLKRSRVLHGVSLTVPERSIFGFLGANGAGKTTLIHLIVGLRAPIRGSVRVAGFDAMSAEARSRIGYLPERPYFHEHLTGEGLLHYFGALSGMRRAQVDARIPEVLASVGMTDARKVELRRYSKGMLQRIGIAQAILHNPRFLVLDEPMSGLDPLGRKEMRELILKLSAEGRTILFSSHVIPDVEAICDQVALIQKGRMIGAGPVDRLLASVSKGPARSEITLSGIGPSALGSVSGLESVRELAEGVRAVALGQEGVDAVLRQALSAGARVLSVSPVRPSLEELFTR